MHAPSHYQTAIYSFAADTANGSAVVEAVAGSGKTTTAVQCMTHLPGSGAVIAFNKSIQLTLEPLVPNGWSARTFNSLGFESCRTIQPRAELNTRRGKGSKNWTYANRALPSNYREGVAGMARLLAMGKSMGFRVPGCVPNTLDNWHALWQAHSVDLPRDCRDRVLAALPEVYADLTDDTTEIDFDDQVLYPILHDLPTMKFTNILVDESQDMSVLQQFLVLEKFLRPGGRVLAFGDTFQSIYAFRGADSSAMNHARDLFGAKSLPLSISYRCPTSVVDLARKFCPHIEAREGAPEGEVRDLERLPEPTAIPQDAMILCRNNAPLLAVGLSFLRAGIPCRMRNNISTELKSFVKKFKTTDLNTLGLRLEDWYGKEIRDIERSGQHGRRAYVEDRTRSLKLLISSCHSVDDILKTIDRIFNKTNGPIVSTIHKSKGLEAPDVYLLRPDLIPSRWATHDWEFQQENNLLYVAYTRAQDSLYIVHDGDEQ